MPQVRCHTLGATEYSIRGIGRGGRQALWYVRASLEHMLCSNLLLPNWHQSQLGTPMQPSLHRTDCEKVSTLETLTSTIQ